jgi:uncharacterized protein (TIGR03067 family)
MPISVQCTGCRKKYKAKDELAGKRIKCPNCDAYIAVPSAQHPAQQSAAVVVASSPASRRAWRWYIGGGIAALVVVGVGAGFFVARPNTIRSSDAVNIAVVPNRTLEVAATASESAPSADEDQPHDVRSDVPARSPDAMKKRDRDIKLLQGSWLPRKVYVEGYTEAAALYGGEITIDGESFSNLAFDFQAPTAKTVIVKRTITRLDATKSPPEFDLKMEGDGPAAGQISKAIYFVDAERLEFVICEPGIELPKNFSLFGTTEFVGVDKGMMFYQCVRKQDQRQGGQRPGVEVQAPGVNVQTPSRQSPDSLNRLLIAVKDHKESKRGSLVALPDAIAILDHYRTQDDLDGSFSETYSTHLNESKLVAEYGAPDESVAEYVSFSGLPSGSKKLKMARYGWLRIYFASDGEICGVGYKK